MRKLLFILPAILLTAAACNQAPSQPTTERNSQTAVLATIEVSGSTNTLPYSINVNTDGSGNITIQGKPAENFESGTIDAQKLKNILDQIPDISLLTGGLCGKPASFGTVTKITYNGKTSGDISCTPETHWPQAGYDLNKFVNNAQLQLKIKNSRN